MPSKVHLRKIRDLIIESLDTGRPIERKGRYSKQWKEMTTTNFPPSYEYRVQPVVDYNAAMRNKPMKRCPVCRGSGDGTSRTRRCFNCNGAGFVPEEEE